MSMNLLYLSLLFILSVFSKQVNKWRGIRVLFSFRDLFIYPVGVFIYLLGGGTFHVVIPFALIFNVMMY